MRKLELTGLRFGRWVVQNLTTSRNGARAWCCVCDCGNVGVVIGWQLKNGNSKSCGCWSRDQSVLRETTHGMTKHPLFNVWKGIKSRCYNKNNASYRDYGLRGIAVCEEWINSFETFHKDMHEGYKEGLTIERKNVNKGYSKDNCCWITKLEQSKNRRNTIYVTTEMGILSVTEAAKIAGVSWFCMRNRHYRNCPIEKMLLPPHKAGRSFTDE